MREDILITQYIVERVQVDLITKPSHISLDIEAISIGRTHMPFMA
jgi:hypothetical protein